MAVRFAGTGAKNYTIKDCLFFSSSKLECVFFFGRLLLPPAMAFLGCIHRLHMTYLSCRAGQTRASGRLLLAATLPPLSNGMCVGVEIGVLVTSTDIVTLGAAFKILLVIDTNNKSIPSNAKTSPSTNISASLTLRRVHQQSGDLSNTKPSPSKLYLLNTTVQTSPIMLYLPIANRIQQHTRHPLPNANI